MRLKTLILPYLQSNISFNEFCDKKSHIKEVHQSMIYSFIELYNKTYKTRLINIPEQLHPVDMYKSEWISICRKYLTIHDPEKLFLLKENNKAKLQTAKFTFEYENGETRTVNKVMSKENLQKIIDYLDEQLQT